MEGEREAEGIEIPLQTRSWTGIPVGAGEGCRKWALLPVSVRCPALSSYTCHWRPSACAQHAEALAISSRLGETQPGSSVSQGSTQWGRPRPPGREAEIRGAWLRTSFTPIPAQPFHQDSQAGARAWAPQSLLSCRSQEENSFQLNYPSHSNIITLQ